MRITNPRVHNGRIANPTERVKIEIVPVASVYELGAELFG